MNIETIDQFLHDLKIDKDLFDQKYCFDFSKLDVLGIILGLSLLPDELTNELNGFNDYVNNSPLSTEDIEFLKNIKPVLNLVKSNNSILIEKLLAEYKEEKDNNVRVLSGCITAAPSSEIINKLGLRFLDEDSEDEDEEFEEMD